MAQVFLVFLCNKTTIVFVLFYNLSDKPSFGQRFLQSLFRRLRGVLHQLGGFLIDPRTCPATVHLLSYSLKKKKSHFLQMFIINLPCYHKCWAQTVNSREIRKAMTAITQFLWWLFYSNVKLSLTLKWLVKSHKYTCLLCVQNNTRQECFRASTCHGWVCDITHVMIFNYSHGIALNNKEIKNV